MMHINMIHNGARNAQCHIPSSPKLPMRMMSDAKEQYAGHLLLDK